MTIDTKPETDEYSVQIKVGTYIKNMVIEIPKSEHRTLGMLHKMIEEKVHEIVEFTYFIG